VKAQNWFAVGLDFIIVVAGVFIGLQVQQWNEARKDAVQHEKLLGRLKRNFVISNLWPQSWSPSFIRRGKAPQMSSMRCAGNSRSGRSLRFSNKISSSRGG
jgi:hypothetical protein